jgi:hypothetical protein
MKTIDELIIEHGADSEIVQEAIYEKELYEARVKGKTWEELAQNALDAEEFFQKLGL